MAQSAITIDAAVLESIAKFRAVLEAASIPIDKMLLFGSYAKGNARANSDIDVAVVSKNFGYDDVEEMQTLYKLTHLADIRIEPYPLAPNDLSDSWSPIVEEIRAHGIEM